MTPGSGYYESKIKSNKKMLKEYRRHYRGQWYFPSNWITSFIFKSSDNVFHYKRGVLIIKKAEMNASWNVPAEYYKPIKIKLIKAQIYKIRDGVKRIDTGQITNPRDFVEYNGGFPCWYNHFSYRIACMFRFCVVNERIGSQELNSILLEICQSNSEYNHLQELKAEIYKQNGFGTRECQGTVRDH